MTQYPSPIITLLRNIYPNPSALYNMWKPITIFHYLYKSLCRSVSQQYGYVRAKNLTEFICYSSKNYRQMGGIF